MKNDTAVLEENNSITAQNPTGAGVNLNINGKAYQLPIRPWTSLLDALREYADLTGTKKGCDHGQCGACTVLCNGERILSCLAGEGGLHSLQKAFIEHDAFQCGYCTPGQICSAIGMMNENKAHSRAEVKELMSGNLCRCGANTNIIDAIMEVKEGGSHE
jgi:xanthine dehydrogenase YagT iron-sulfur-binding subunit